jgi:hypothetical protein
MLGNYQVAIQLVACRVVFSSKKLVIWSCEICGFQGGYYEEWRLLGYYAVWLL